MAIDPVRERYDVFFAADFMPTIRHQQSQGSPERIAYAAEYWAQSARKDQPSIGTIIDVLDLASGEAKE